MFENENVKKHFDELRVRILRIVIIVAGVAAFLMTCHAQPVDISGYTIYYPTLNPLDNIAAQITDYMRAELVPDNVQLIQTAPGQAFFAQVYVAALVGIIVSMPAIARECIMFLRPALRKKEQRLGRMIFLPVLALFVGGCVFSYVAVIPYILDFLYKYGESAGLVTFLNVIDFVIFVLQFLLAFGISFQLPMIMYAISAAGIVDSKYWIRNSRYAIVAIIIFGAVITPDGSGVTMWFIAIPMIALYFAGVGVIKKTESRPD